MATYGLVRTGPGKQKYQADNTEFISPRFPFTPDFTGSVHKQSDWVQRRVQDKDFINPRQKLQKEKYLDNLVELSNMLTNSFAVEKKVLPPALKPPGPPGPPSAGPPSARPPSAGPPSAGPPSAGPPSAGPPSAGPPSAGPGPGPQYPDPYYESFYFGPPPLQGSTPPSTPGSFPGVEDADVMPMYDPYDDFPGVEDADVMPTYIPSVVEFPSGNLPSPESVHYPSVPGSSPGTVHYPSVPGSSSRGSIDSGSSRVSKGYSVAMDMIARVEKEKRELEKKYEQETQRIAQAYDELDQLNTRDRQRLDQEYEKKFQKAALTMEQLADLDSFEKEQTDKKLSHLDSLKDHSLLHSDYILQNMSREREQLAEKIERLEHERNLIGRRLKKMETIKGLKLKIPNYLGANVNSLADQAKKRDQENLFGPSQQASPVTPSPLSPSSIDSSNDEIGPMNRPPARPAVRAKRGRSDSDQNPPAKNIRKNPKPSAIDTSGRNFTKKSGEQRMKSKKAKTTISDLIPAVRAKRGRSDSDQNPPAKNIRKNPKPSAIDTSVRNFTKKSGEQRMKSKKAKTTISDLIPIVREKRKKKDDDEPKGKKPKK